MKLLARKLNSMPALSALLALVLVGCTSTKKATTTTADGYVPTSIEQLRSDTEAFRDQRVVLEAYILGMEYGTNADDADQWIMVLGLEPQFDDSIAGQLIFPKVEAKVRVAEDGYNREILRRCFQICSESRRKGGEITIYGRYQPKDKSDRSPVPPLPRWVFHSARRSYSWRSMNSRMPALKASA